MIFPHWQLVGRYFLYSPFLLCWRQMIPQQIMNLFTEDTHDDPSATEFFILDCDRCKRGKN